MLSSTTILNIKITLNDKKDIIDCVLDYLQKKSGRPLIIYTPNPEQIVQAREMAEFAKVLNSADISLPDGQRLVWASKQLSAFSHQLSERIAGIEFVEELVKIAAEKGYPVGFIGGRKGSASEALNKLKNKYPELTGWTEEGEEFRIKNLELRIKGKNKKNPNSLFIIHNSSLAKDDYFNKLAKQIIARGTKLVFVGLGAPKQEFFIEKLRYYLLPRSADWHREIPLGIPRLRQPAVPRDDREAVVLMSVGGAFDIISGRLPRVPKTLSNFEFIWRLILEPGRFVRQLRLLRFIFLVFRQRFVLK